MLLSVMLTAPFGEASAELFEPVPGDFTVELRVEVVDPAVTVVVAQVALLDGRVMPVALVEVAPGRWAGALTLAHLENARVAFDALAPGAESEVSAVVSLIDLGVPVEMFVEEGEAPTGSGTDSSPSWLRVGAVVLVGLAVFVGTLSVGWRRISRT